METAFSLPMLGRLAKKKIWASLRVSVFFMACTITGLFSAICSCLAAV